MRFERPANVSIVLVGLHKIGIVGLGDAIRAAKASGLTDREAIVELMLKRLTEANYMPESGLESVRQAIWREYLRSTGAGFRDFYSEIDVTVRGVPGPDRDRFVQMLISVFGDFELRPKVTFDKSDPLKTVPELIFGGDSVARGPVSREGLKRAVKQRISDW